MSYEPRLQRNATAKISQFLHETYRTRAAYDVATEEIRLALLRLAASPKLAVSPPGPFETRPIYRFALNADGSNREVEVCFCFDVNDPGERTILITDFREV